VHRWPRKNDTKRFGDLFPAWDGVSPWGRADRVPARIIQPDVPGMVPQQTSMIDAPQNWAGISA